MGIGNCCVENNIGLLLDETCFSIDHTLCAFESFAHQPRAGGAPHPAEGEGDVFGLGFICKDCWFCRGFFEQGGDFLAGWTAEYIAPVIVEGMQGDQPTQGAGGEGAGGGEGGGGHRGAVVSYQLSVGQLVSCQLSVVSYQLSGLRDRRCELRKS